MFRLLVFVAMVSGFGLGTLSAQDVWNLNDDWQLQGYRHGPGRAFGPDDAWTIRANDASTHLQPALAFTDLTENYFTPTGCLGGQCAQRWIAGYAPGNASAVFKVYANRDPWYDFPISEREKPADHNMDPLSGILDVGDVGAIPGGGGGTGQIVWRAPRDMTITASFEAYSVGTNLPVGQTPNPNATPNQTRIHFLVRDTPGTGPINPEGEPAYLLNGFVPESLGGDGREYVSGEIAPFEVTAGQEVYVKVNPLFSFGGSSRNIVGFSELEVREFLGTPGDFNNDGVVDAADYTVWSDSQGSQADYDVWKSNFQSYQGAVGSAAAVPEPSTMLLVGFAVSLMALKRRKS